MTKAQFIAEMSAKCGLTKVDTEKAYEAFLKTVEIHLTTGDDVPFLGFGTFKVVKRAERQGRDPKTGATITVKASQSVNFKVGSKLKEALNSTK